MRTNFDKNIARLQFQGADMVKLHNEKLNEEKETEINNRNTMITESAYLNIGSDIHTKRMRKQNAERAMNYQEHFAVLALTEALSDCVKDSLLLNREEYAKLNENYETEIHDTIKGFLENAEINEDINNPQILALYEEILKEVPPADLYLTEEDERMIVRQNILSKDAIKSGLENLCRDVKARTANIVSKDQASMVDQNDELDEINNKELAAAPLVPPSVDDTAAMEDVPLADPDAIDPVQSPEVPAVEDVPAPVQESYNPKIVKEQRKQGIVETLAMNEAEKMICEGKEYNSTLALANALKYITILETLDASSLVTIGTPGYNRILSASGVNMNPIKAVDIPGADIHENPIHTVMSSEMDAQPKDRLPETPKESELKCKISSMIRDSMPSELTVGKELSSEVFKPYSEWKKEHSVSDIDVFDTPNKPIVEEVDLHGKYTNSKGEIFTEEQLYEFFENQGFAVGLMDFEDLWRSWNFKKH